VKYQLDKQMNIVKDVRQTSVLQLTYTHVNIESIIYIKKQDISDVTSLKLLLKSPIEASSMLNINLNLFSSFKNLLDLKFSGFIETTSDFEKCISKDIFNLNPKIDIIRPIQDLSSLINLSITQCPIESLENGIFKCLVNLKNLDLSSNKIKTLKKENFEGLENLINLNLSDNYIKELSGFPFQYLKNLKILNLQYNYINDLHLDSFGYSLVNLEVLDLKNNDFKEIRKNVLKHLTSLKEIHLPGYFVNYSSKNLSKEVGVKPQTEIKVEEPNVSFDVEYL
jgi:Leucine-rich repeat (LRR) protein